MWAASAGGRILCFRLRKASDGAGEMSANGESELYVMEVEGVSVR